MRLPERFAGGLPILWAAVVSMAIGCSAPSSGSDAGSVAALDGGQSDAGVDGGVRTPTLTACQSGTVDAQTESIVSVPGGFVALVKSGSTYRLERLLGARCALTLDQSYQPAPITTAFKPNIDSDDEGRVYIETRAGLQEVGVSGATSVIHRSVASTWAIGRDGLSLLEVAAVSSGGDSYVRLSVARRAGAGATFDPSTELYRVPSGGFDGIASGPAGVVALVGAATASLPKRVAVIGASGSLNANFGERQGEQGVCLPTDWAIMNDVLLVADSNCVVGLSRWSLQGQFLGRTPAGPLAIIDAVATGSGGTAWLLGQPGPTLVAVEGL